MKKSAVILALLALLSLRVFADTQVVYDNDDLQKVDLPPEVKRVVIDTLVGECETAITKAASVKLTYKKIIQDKIERGIVNETYVLIFEIKSRQDKTGYILLVVEHPDRDHPEHKQTQVTDLNSTGVCE